MMITARGGYLSCGDRQDHLRPARLAKPWRLNVAVVNGGSRSLRTPLAFDHGWWRSYSGRSSPPQFIESDLYAANALARIICRTDARRAAFIEYCYQEALVIIEQNKPVVLALARA
jgi:hypothetical protein